MNDVVLVSIILPVYNGCRFLEHTLNSLITQDFKLFEVIAVNDGSTDDSLKLLEKYRKQDGRIVIINQENGGICKARNTGIEQARGRYIMFCDQDDIYKTNYVRCAYSGITSNNYDFVKFGCEEIYDYKGQIKDINTYQLKDEEYTGKDVVDVLFQYDKYNEYIWDGIYKKEIVVACGGFDSYFEAGCEDVDLFLKLVSKSQSCKVFQQIGYEHYIRSGYSTSRKFNEKTYEAVLKIYLDRASCLRGKTNNTDYMTLKTGQMLWALLGMFSFKSCNLTIKEIAGRFQDVGKIPMVRENVAYAHKDKKMSLVLKLFKKRYYKLLAAICVIKRRLT